MRTFKRCLSVLVAVTMIFTMFMTLGIAEGGEGYSPETGENEAAATYTETDEENIPESDTATPGTTEGTDGETETEAKSPGGYITGFAELDQLTGNQYWPVGTTMDKLTLPSGLTATILSGDNVTEETVPVSGWRSNPEYDPETLGTYVFSPELSLPEGVSMGENVTPPRITVEIKQFMGITPTAANATVSYPDPSTLKVTVNSGSDGSLDSVLNGVASNSNITTMLLTGNFPACINTRITIESLKTKFPNMITLDLTNFAADALGGTPFPGGSTKIETIKLPAAGTLPNYAFQDFTALTTVYTGTTGESGLVDLSTATCNFDPSGYNYMFNRCSSIKKVKLKSDVSLKTSMFAYCSSLTTVYTNSETPDLVDLSGLSVSALGAFAPYVFDSCTKISAVKLPSGAKLPSGIFLRCSGLKTVYTGTLTAETAGLVDLSSCTSFTSAELRECTSITTVKLPKNVSLSSQMFLGCTSLTTVYTDVKVPNLVDLSEIGSPIFWTFPDCRSISSIKLPNGASVTDLAFGGLPNLKAIALPATPPSFKNNSFSEQNPSDPSTATPIGQMLLVDDAVKSGYVLPANLPINSSFPTISGTTSLQAGDSLSFSVSPDVSTVAAVTYQWKKDGVDISGATGRTYSKANVIATDGGSYTCTVSLGGTTYTTDPVTVTVNLLTLTGTPIIEGKAEIREDLTVNTKNLNTKSGLKYQWKSNNQNISGATGATYTVRGSDAGKTITVTVAAPDTHSNSITSAETLVVPYIIKLMPLGNVIGKDSVSFSTVGTSVTIDYTLDGSYIVNKIVFGHTNGISIIPTVTVPGTGSVKYTVNASNSLDGEINITASFIHQTMITNRNVLLTPPMNGETPQQAVPATAYYTTVTWSPDHAPFKGNTSYTANIKLEATGKADFDPGFVPTVNGGPAANVRVSTDGRKAEFTYTFPPTLDKTVESIKVTKQPQLVYTSGDKLNLSGLEVTATFKNPATTEVIPFAKLTGASYSINGTTVTNGNTFLTYVAHDQKEITILYGGKADKTGMLKVHTLPTIKTSVSDVTSSSAKISYTVINSGDYMTKTLEVLNDSVWTAVSTASSYTENNLKSNTTYQYRVHLFDNDTKREYESPISFKTLANNPTGVSVSGTVTNDKGKPVVVTIERGNTVIASAEVTNEVNGNYSFDFINIPDGTYNLVAYNGEHKVTHALTVSRSNIKDINLNMKQGKMQSMVQIIGSNTPPVTAKGLSELFNSNFYTDNGKKLVLSGGEVEFKLVVERMAASAIPSDAEKIKSLASGKEIGLYLDLSVIKSRYDANGKLLDRIFLTDLGKNLIDVFVELPDNLKNKGNLTVYRVHNGRAEVLTYSSDISRESAKVDGGYIELRVRKFSTYAIAYNVNSRDSSSSSGGRSGNSGSAVTVGTQWIELPDEKTLANDALSKQLDYARSSSTAITGIRKNSLLALAESGLRYRHDTVADGAVQVRVQVDDPSKATKDILVSGYVEGVAVDNVKAKFKKTFQNKFAVISMDQEGGFGLKVQIMAKVDLSGMNTENLYFYSYDKKNNKYVRIETEYRIDKNGYLHFATMLGGDIIVSDGSLAKHGAKQASGAFGTLPHDLDNPGTGGDSPSATWIDDNISPLTIENSNPITSVDSPVEMWTTGKSLPLTIENYSLDNGSEQEIMLSASTSRNGFGALKNGGYVNMRMIVIAVVLLLAGILVGVDIPRLRKMRTR